MKQTTKYLLGFAAASALVIGATNGVFARGGFGPGWGGHQGMMGGPGGMGGPFGRSDVVQETLVDVADVLDVDVCGS